MLNKKLISAFVLVIYIISLFPAVSFAEDVTFYFSDNFDSYVTNEKPTVGEIKGLNSRIYEHKEGSDKAMALKATVAKTSFKYTAPKALKQFVWSLDINPLEGIPTGTLTLGLSGTVINIANITPDGRIKAHDGRIIGGIAKNRFTKLAFSVDLTNRNCDFYYNGKLVLDNWYLGTSAPKSVTGINMEFFVKEDEPSLEVLIDNLYIYDGLNLVSDDKLPKNTYNPNSVEFTEEEEPVFDQVYINRTFDEEDAGSFDSLTVTPGSYNKFTIEEEKDGNKYLYMQRYGDGDCWFATPATVSSPKVFVEFSLKSTANPLPQFMFLRDSNGKDCYLFRVSDEGEFQLYNGNVPVTKLSTSKWTHFGLALNFAENKMDLYVNGKLTLAKQAIPSSPADYTFIRFGGVASGIDMSLKYDNIKVYDGDNFRDVTESQGAADTPSVMPTYADVPGKLSGFVALQLHGESFFAKGQRTKLDAPAFTKDGRTLVPVRVISEAFGLDVGWDADAQKVTVGSDIEMTIGSKNMKVGSKTINLEVAPEISNGRTFLPLRALCEDALGKKVFWDDRGLIVIGDREFTERAGSLANVNNYMLYDRPESETLLEMFKEKSANVHPRVMADKATFDRIRAAYASNHPQIKPWVDHIIAYSDQVLGVPPHEADFVTFSVFLTTSRDIQKRIESLGLAYQITGDKKYVDRIWKEVEHSGNFPHWNNTHYLDTSHMMAAFAVAYDWCFDAWKPDQLNFMEEKMVKHALSLSYNEYRRQGCWWPVVNINWNAVCNGSTALAAIALMDARPEYCASLVEDAIRGVEFCVNEFFPAGSWPEGTGYSDYTIRHMVKMSSTLKATFGTDFNITRIPGFNLAPLDLVYNNSQVGSNNYHDASSELVVTPECFYIADIFDIPAYSDIYVNYHESGIKDPSVAAVIYYNTDKPASGETLPLDKYFVGTEAGSMRSAWGDPTGTYIGFHGGNAVENHGHMDSGTYVVDMLGERIIVDVGAAPYDHPDYSSDRRYNVYKARPEAHNMIVINPDKTPGINPNSYAPIISQTGKPRGAITVMDLTPAYDYAKDYKRAYILDDDRRSVIVRDELHLKKEYETYWFMTPASGAELKVIDQNTATIDYEGKKFLVKIFCDAPGYEFYDMDAVSLPKSPYSEGQNGAAGYRKFAIKFKASGKVNIAMKIIPYDDPMANRPLENIAIDDWVIPDGERLLIPKLENIYVDGIGLEGFKQSETAYTVNVLEGKGVPTITALCGDDATYEVTPAADLSGTTAIKVISKANPDLYRYYYISYRPLGFGELNVAGGLIDGYTRYEIYNMYASHEPQPENNALNVFDGSIGTTWAFTGTGEYLWVDLGEAKPVNAIVLAAGRGTTRSLYYSIQVSDDCQNWKTIYDGTTEFTNDMRIIPVPETTTRFVRFVLNGNSTGNSWSAVTEFGPLYR